MKTKDSFKLSKEGLSFVKKQLNRYETKRSAILPCLYRVQKENGGWISSSAVSYLSEVMEIPSADINEVLTFYTLYNRRPVGRLHVQVCCNLSCAMNGSRELFQNLCKHFQVNPKEVSADGLVSLSRVECLGACEMAPVAQVNDHTISLKPEMAPQQITQLLEKKDGA